MNLKDVENLIEKIDGSSISLFEIKMDNLYIKMDKSLERNHNEVSKNKVIDTIETKKEDITASNIAPTSGNAITEVISNEISESKSVDDSNVEVITSPMVGTFYEAPGAGSSVFVKVGQKINVGDTLCIIEAMKLMNEIEAELTGEIVEILVSNGQMVEFGTELFKVRR
ncbi:acetyl-CoA carboxylase biotin carboxyl carrier protein [uncultured Clostridium sp.]|uniref:acetyl-CoA carboxylase biotin carboxyl carrier protein n=1 Tax=uncultured Clostridium sp. TaxID=59620 RepID=UPI0026206584|nr:acetyl-CoA carboxylase biotin carboxyl carrier protein [uncultured Clostridium sp.]